jgi:uncharacterized protein YegL
MTETLHLAAPRRDAQMAEALRDFLTVRNFPVRLWIADSDTQIADAVATHDYYSAVFSSETAEADVVGAALRQGHEAVIERQAIVAASPLVIGWSRDAAERLGGENLGWQTLIEQSERSDFQVMHASATGTGGPWTLAALAQAAGDAGDINGELLRRRQSRTTGYAGDDLEIADLLPGQPVDAFVAPEDAAIRACQSAGGRYLISMPEEGTYLIRRPLLVARVGGYINEQWLRREIETFDDFEPLLRSSSWYSALDKLGYRDPSGQITPSAALPQYVTSPPKFPSYWQAPTASAMAAIPALWADVKRPVSILLLIDISGSMNGGKLNSAKAAIRHFLGNIFGADDQLGLTAFGSAIDDVVPLQPATSGAAAIEASLSGITAGGNTVLFDTVEAAIDQLCIVSQNHLRAIVLLSDGADNGSVSTLEAVRACVRDLDGFLIYAVSYPGGDEDALNRLVSAGKGQVLQSDPQSIVRLYETISRRF